MGDSHRRGATPTQGAGQLPPRPLRGRLRGHGGRRPRRRRAPARRGGSGARSRWGCACRRRRRGSSTSTRASTSWGCASSGTSKRGTAKRYVYTYPSKKRASRRSRPRCRQRRPDRTTNQSLTVLLHRLNPVLRGWTNYFRHGAASKTFAYLSRLHLAAGVVLAAPQAPQRHWKLSCDGATSGGGGRPGRRDAVQPGHGADHPLPLPGSSIPSPWATTTGSAA